MHAATSYVSSSQNINTKMARSYFESYDLDLPILYPIAGNVSNDVFSSIIDILMTNVFPYSPFKQNASYADIVKGFTNQRLEPLDHIRNKMSFQRKAVITRASTGISEVDLSSRICNRRTFKSDVVSLLSKVITEFLKMFGIIVQNYHKNKSKKLLETQ